MKILHLDTTHPFLGKELEKIGFTNHYDFDTLKSRWKKDIQKKENQVVNPKSFI